MEQMAFPWMGRDLVSAVAPPPVRHSKRTGRHPFPPLRVDGHVVAGPRPTNGWNSTHDFIDQTIYGSSLLHHPSDTRKMEIALDGFFQPCPVVQVDSDDAESGGSALHVFLVAPDGLN